ncbi:MAG: hypothetical protein GQ581_11030 [Methyloprofundus sp.]|nr:hypothetical protein [Methyloprofundus sp.]
MNNNKAKAFAAKTLESILVIGYILFEELIWNIFAEPIYRYCKSLIAIEPLKKLFLGMHRYLLLMVFVAILAMAEVMGFVAGYSFVSGNIILGMSVYALKIPVAAFTFWLFDLTKEQLMSFHWLATAYEFVVTWIERFKASAIHVYIKSHILVIRAKLRQLKLDYFGEAGFMASLKVHYQAFKPHISSIFKR